MEISLKHKIEIPGQKCFPIGLLHKAHFLNTLSVVGARFEYEPCQPGEVEMRVPPR